MLRISLLVWGLLAQAGGMVWALNAGLPWDGELALNFVAGVFLLNAAVLIVLRLSCRLAHTHRHQRNLAVAGTGEGARCWGELPVGKRRRAVLVPRWMRMVSLPSDDSRSFTRDVGGEKGPSVTMSYRARPDAWRLLVRPGHPEEDVCADDLIVGAVVLAIEDLKRAGRGVTRDAILEMINPSLRPKGLEAIRVFFN